MKKIIFLITAGVLVMTSCKKDEIGGTATEKLYSGEWVVAQTCKEYSDDDTAIEDGRKLIVANSAANVENEIIIQTNISSDLDGIPLAVRGKFKLNGNPTEFKGENAISENYVANKIPNANTKDYFIIFNGNFYPVKAIGSPDGLGEEYDAMQLYVRFSLDKGNIIKDGAKTIGGYKQDAISVELTFYHDEVVIESYETDKKTWKDPNVPEYDWRVKDGSRKNSEGAEEHWTLKGYRYTGFDND